MLVPVTFTLSEEQAKRIERTNLKNCLEILYRVANRYKDMDPEAAVAMLELEKYKDVLVDVWRAAHHKIFEIKLTPPEVSHGKV